jgi:hypothetical protein
VVTPPRGAATSVAPDRKEANLGTLLLALLAAGSLPSAFVAPTVAAPPHAGTAKHKRHCDPNYRGRCLKPNVSDYDCAGGSGNGPYYVSGPFTVVGYDHYRLDSDHDGIACE